MCVWTLSNSVIYISSASEGEVECVSGLRVSNSVIYCRSTIFHCHLIFVGRGKNENKKHANIQHDTKQWYHSAFSGPNLKI